MCGPRSGQRDRAIPGDAGAFWGWRSFGCGVEMVGRRVFGLSSSIGASLSRRRTRRSSRSQQAYVRLTPRGSRPEESPCRAVSTIGRPSRVFGEGWANNSSCWRRLARWRRCGRRCAFGQVGTSDQIGIDFTTGRGENNNLGPTEVAGANNYVQNNWNMITGNVNNVGVSQGFTVVNPTSGVTRTTRLRSGGARPTAGRSRVLRRRRRTAG